MQLIDWMKSQNKTQKAVANELRVSNVTVCRYLSGIRKPKNNIMMKITTMTGGLVTPNDFYLQGNEAKMK